MSQRIPGRRFRPALALVVLATATVVHAQTGAGTSGKLVLTGGVSQVEGTGGGGLVPWALIGGQGAAGQVGASAYYTHVALDDYSLDSFGALVGVSDRIEVSLARQRFDTRNVGAALGLGRGFTIQQDIVGVKLRLAGDAIVEQDAWLPQIAIGFQYKRNDQPGLLAAIGARDHNDFEPYLAATKLYLAQSLLVNGTLRYTRANQFGLLGFGGDLRNSRRLRFEGSAALLLRRNLALGVEYRSKPDNLGIAREDDAFDLFVAWAPSKHWSLTLAYVDLGNIVIADHQRGLYASLQVGF